MLHLTADRLAALADEQPTAIEAAHLAACPTCCHERAAHHRVRELARLEVTRALPPLTTWEGVSAALARGDGDRTSDIAHRKSLRPSHFPLPASRFPRSICRLAAAAALLTVGLAAGRYSAGAAPLTFGTRAAADTVRVVATLLEDGVRERVPDSLARFQSAADALVALSRAERQYQLAATYLAAQDGTVEPFADSSAVFRTRLAALDAVMAGTRTALYEAPHDPVINRYYLTMLGAREATVRQLGTSLPEGQSVSRF